MLRDRSIDAHLATIDSWREAGGTHASVCTMGMGLDSIEAHIDYIAEIKSKKWIYLGENHQRIPTIHLNFFYDYFLTDYGLTQMLIIVQE